ncbi:bis(5'-nucleosyl)-tetraphosphatase (symmetrical) YqeK [Paenibacillus larvae]|uniref:bis(5'-nucleosyl)-tetraphosphatase (symmetrical) n=1 Tax=Paenibacillus larvae TaxID=1464 RepID=A0AAP5JVS8_9BACL|nr:bis(5'-nucleosyl)-tetraphosphatase (symmetrical) YqeK [Paenibacillus larvae]AQR77487.1 HD domain-containing protein [Paenibacillus larvae subsp. larvae]AVF21475.1 hydrolase, HD family [Paenibacillus larvae subsp. larvae]ETK30265.1 hydrolase, HD family [Paenibacillus larvae subsp. larvae DSM 25719]MCY7477639.1 bis(5'-nucleosyl)-tetraphosphatase (symmetrical) YqeK [Paenibacillus larvae]MCY7489581.1 bis(5'-nucleosyl)-tetraphosphatase (symmetrical) YqeK [Paenibacillus larvae]
MNRTEIIEAVKEQMPERRWKHTLGVRDTAVILAGRFGEDKDKADLAAILHDVCKYWTIQDQEAIIRENNLPQDLLHYDKQLLHSHAGAYVAEIRFGIKDEDILNAIRFHTSGREQMSKLEKIICLADYMEPGRDFPGVDKIRKLAETSLEEALIAGFDSTISFLIQQGKKIYPLTVLTRNSLLDEIRGKSSS